MSRFSDDAELIAELRSLRPAPEPEFAAALDERATAGFPHRSRFAVPWIGPLTSRLQALSPRRIALPAGAAALAAIVVATAIVVVGESGENDSPQLSIGRGNGVERSEPPGAAGELLRSKAAQSDSAASSGEGVSAASESVQLRAAPLSKRLAGKRAVERSAEIVLASDPTRVADDAAEVFDAVRAHDGIVMRSTIRDGARAGAEFVLLIPSGKLGDAMASFSRIAEVRSRREATADITAATVGVGELVRDSRARIEGLLGQLAAATTEGEREAVETELRAERRRRAALRSRLADLRQRADFSRVSLRIEAANASDSTGWGIGDALEDAGHILAVAAAVTLIGLAILAPLAALALLAWLSRHAWLRWSRRQALG